MTYAALPGTDTTPSPSEIIAGDVPTEGPGVVLYNVSKYLEAIVFAYQTEDTREALKLLHEAGHSEDPVLEGIWNLAFHAISSPRLI